LQTVFPDKQEPVSVIQRDRLNYRLVLAGKAELAFQSEHLFARLGKNKSGE
jgi:hypothetical protein